MKLKKIGFYKELVYGDQNSQSIHEVTSKFIMQNEDEVIEYLSKGTILITAMGISKDVISGAVIGSPDYLTDGEWCWNRDLIHYLQIYHLKLPNDFLCSIEAKKFIINMIPQDELELLEI